MPQADVFALVDELVGTRSDTLALPEAASRARYYADVVYENGLQREMGSVNAAFVAVVEGTATYAQPATAIRTIGLIYDDKQLRPTARQGNEAYDKDWRSRKGRPAAFTTQDEDLHTFRLVPVPNLNGETIGVSTPFTGSFPDNNLTFLYTDNVTDVLPWDEMWVALEVISRETGRDSDHFDPTLSKLARQLAAMLRVIVGYES